MRGQAPTSSFGIVAPEREDGLGTVADEENVFREVSAWIRLPFVGLVWKDVGGRSSNWSASGEEVVLLLLDDHLVAPL